jgi:hypothetical protein
MSLWVHTCAWLLRQLPMALCMFVEPWRVEAQTSPLGIMTFWRLDGQPFEVLAPAMSPDLQQLYSRLSPAWYAGPSLLTSPQWLRFQVPNSSSQLPPLAVP